MPLPVFFFPNHESSNLSNSLLNTTVFQSAVHLTVACRRLQQPSYVSSKTLGASVAEHYLFRTNDSQTPCCQRIWGEVMHICMYMCMNLYGLFIKCRNSIAALSSNLSWIYGQVPFEIRSLVCFADYKYVVHQNVPDQKARIHHYDYHGGPFLSWREEVFKRLLGHKGKWKHNLWNTALALSPLKLGQQIF